MATALDAPLEVQNAEVQQGNTDQANVDQNGPVAFDQANAANQDAGNAGGATGPGQVAIGNEAAGNQAAGNEAPSQGQSSAGGVVEQLKADLNKLANENQVASAALAKLEQSSGLQREQLVLAITGALAGVVSLYLLAGAGAAFVANVLIGAAYPAVASLRALKNQDKSQNNQLLAYWAIFGALLFADSLLSEVPAYFLLKAAALLALSLPQVRGAELVYNRALEPALNQLDALLQKKSE